MGMIYGLVAIMGLLGVVTAKFLTTKKIQALRQLIVQTQSQNNKTRGELKIVESTTAAARHDLKNEERKLNTTKRQIAKYEKDIESFKKSD